MLVLTRKMNQSVIIDGGIEIMVVGVSGNKVRLGFRAPADVVIKRQECATQCAAPQHHQQLDEYTAPSVIGLS